jgi:uncharacterized protein with FMN-binding domain/Pyruvate/2-oxoacid:ferredoxin oxidoreductase delta subunit
MSAKKTSLPIHFLRIFVQIICLIFLPVIYASTFSGIKNLYIGIINSSLSFNSAFPIFIQVLSTILLTALLGRFFCGWICSFGAVSDWIHAITKKIFKFNFRLPEKADKALKIFKYIYLLILVIVFWNIDFSFLNEANPWNAFSSIFTLKSLPDFASAFQYYAFGTFLLFVILAASMFIERFFCRYLCPLGAIFAVVSRIKIIKINKTRDKCGACKVCTNNCPMGIPMYKHDRISSGECIMCLKCTQVCPRNNAALSAAGTDLNAAVAGTLAAATIAATMYYTGNNLSALSQYSDNTLAYSGNQEGKYKDGTYEGSGTGFRGGTTTVSVTVKNGNISNVEVLSYRDDEPFFSRAKDTVISEIIDVQSADVDAVSGATYSSNGIMEAVDNALSNASNSSNRFTINDQTISTTDEQASESAASTAGEATDSSAADNIKASNRVSGNSSSEKSSYKSEPTYKEKASSTKEQTTSSSTTKENTTITENTDTSNSTIAAVSSGAYKDGTYEGSGTGFRNGTTTVSVTVEGGVISNIEVVSHQDGRQFFSRAFITICSEIIDSQSTDVDAVSGATYSSNGIMEAVANALSSAHS